MHSISTILYYSNDFTISCDPRLRNSETTTSQFQFVLNYICVFKSISKALFYYCEKPCTIPQVFLPQSYSTSWFLFLGCSVPDRPLIILFLLISCFLFFFFPPYILIRFRISIGHKKWRGRVHLHLYKSFVNEQFEWKEKQS